MAAGAAAAPQIPVPSTMVAPGAAALTLRSSLLFFRYSFVSLFIKSVFQWEV